MLLVMASTLMTGCGAFGIECQIKDPSISLNPGDDHAQTSENEKEPVEKAVQQDSGEDQP